MLGAEQVGQQTKHGGGITRGQHDSDLARLPHIAGHRGPAEHAPVKREPVLGQALRAFVGELGLDDAVNFAGSVTGAELEAYLQAADVFVCASEHEGFCVPLAEAMGHGIPIVAYGVTAVPETVGDAGLVLPEKSPLTFAAAVGRVLADDTLRRALASAGLARAAEFNLGRSQQRFVSLVQGAVGS